MVKFAELLDADRRLVILRALEEDPGYDLNEYVLRSVLEALGHTVSRDRLGADLAWLEEQGLVVVDDVAGVKVARLTGRGSDAATGRAVVPGVKRPGPKG